VESDFDAILTLLTPGGVAYENDDFVNTSSCLVQLALPETGTYTVTVSSFSGSGHFDLEIALSAAPLAQVKAGELGTGDSTGFSGALEDTFTFQGRRGTRVRLQLTSPDFDPLVRLIAPNGVEMENDDMLLSIDSWLTSILEQDGEYRVVVTSYSFGEEGNYILVMDQSAPSQRLVTGDLSFSDERLQTGEYVDTIYLNGTAGQKINVTACSADFDTYVILISPGDVQFENDDYMHSNAEISMTLPETGEYRMLVTSAVPGETGAYSATIDLE
jgi:hypothetical protein